MGSSGHKFIAHTKALSPRASASGGGFGLPPHPLEIRTGQRFFPRSGERRVAFDVVRVRGDKVTIRREDGALVRALGLARLLAVGSDGQGKAYQFLGFLPRRYRTVAYVAAVDERDAVLCLPEWHPGRPVRYFPALLPEGARAPGAWITVRCDLSAPSGARLQLADLAAAPAPAPGTVHVPALPALPVATG